jgi:tetratricopeptide (TPR) repeat protein
MAQRRKTYRHFSWNYFTFHLLLIAGLALLLMQVYHFPSLITPLLFAFAAYFAYSTVARGLILTHHQRGMKFFRQKHYHEAILSFQQSIQYLNANAWIDRHRWLVLLSSSALSYREMAMFNIGAAYVYLDNAREARKAFESFLMAFPFSQLAPTVRKLMLTLETKKKK